MPGDYSGTLMFSLEEQVTFRELANNIFTTMGIIFTHSNKLTVFTMFLVRARKENAKTSS